MKKVWGAFWALVLVLVAGSGCLFRRDLVVLEVVVPKNREGQALLTISNLAAGGRYSKKALVDLTAYYTSYYGGERISWVSADSEIEIVVRELKDEQNRRIGDRLSFTLGEGALTVQGLVVEGEGVQTKILNEYVLEVLSEYEGGNYPYLKNDDYRNYNGVTEDLSYQGQVIAKANPSGDRASHCVGLTFEVFFKAMQKRNKEAGLSPEDFNGMTVADLEDFLLTWYVAKGNEDVQHLVAALENYGLGRAVADLEEAQAGDFVQLYRGESGHAVIFLGWLRAPDNKIIGIQYWSTQPSTQGIADREEYFSENGWGLPQGPVNRKRLYLGRVESISAYKSF